MQKSLILASTSPRRADLLTQLGYTFSVYAVDIDESPLPNELPMPLVSRLATEKAKAALCHPQLDKSSVILAADTLISLDNKPLGKPVNQADSERILSLLSNRSHQVLTSICVATLEACETLCIQTNVHFAALTKEQMQAYWQSGEPQDKAGSYAIQGIGGQFVKRIDGSYSAVVGLPLYETAQLLKKFGVAV
jgi:septum formation protein